MKFPCLIVCLLSLPLAPLGAMEEGLVDPNEVQRSPEGKRDLGRLHGILIAALKDERIERRFLALNKIRQLAHNELSRELVSAVVESLDGDNHNYLWFAAHTLQRISGKELGTRRESWREWLRNDYDAAGQQSVSASEAAVLDSGSLGHDNSGGIPALDVHPSDTLGHDPNTKVVEDKPGAKEEELKVASEPEKVSEDPSSNNPEDTEKKDAVVKP